MIFKVAATNTIGCTGNPASALLFDKPRETWDKIKPVYNGTFIELVIGELPEGDAILQDIKKVSERLKAIDWEPG